MTTRPRSDVLVIEADHGISDILIRTLERDGLSTDLAGDVLEAKRLLACGSYTVLILDLILANGTGFDILDFIRADQRTPPHILVITAADVSMIVRLDRSLVKMVTFKPLDIEHFVASVRILAADRSSRFD